MTLLELIFQPRMVVALALIIFAGLFIARTRSHGRVGHGGSVGRRSIPLRFKVGDVVYANYDNGYQRGVVAATWDTNNAYRITLDRGRMNVWARDDHNQFVKGVPMMAVGDIVCVAPYGVPQGFFHATITGHHVGGSAYEVVLKKDGTRHYIHNDVEFLIRYGLRFDVGERVWAKMTSGWFAGEITALHPTNNDPGAAGGGDGAAAYRIHLGRTGLDVYAPKVSS